MSYVITLGPRRGTNIEEVDLAFLQRAVSMHIQPEDLYEACLTELTRRYERDGMDPPQPPAATKPAAFALPAERTLTRIPDSLAEIAAAGGRRPDGVAPPPSSNPASSTVIAAQVPERPVSRPASASESLPMPCGHPTSDLGWKDASKTRSTCIACERLNVLNRLSAEVDSMLDLFRMLEREARQQGWPHTVSKEWEEKLYGPADENA